MLQRCVVVYSPTWIILGEEREREEREKRRKGVERERRERGRERGEREREGRERGYLSTESTLAPCSKRASRHPARS
jgi:hypothetical protein